jgi:hypothetical protein
VKVEHHNIHHYLEDLERVAPTFEGIVVRSDVDVQEKNAGASDVSVVSGFHDHSYMYEIIVDCGELLAGGDDSAIKKAQETIDGIAKRCEKIGVIHGGGRWQE